MQLSVFEMVKKGETISVDVVDAGAREQINELNSSLNGKQNVVDNALMTTAKTIVGAINEINRDLSEIRLEMSTKTQTYSITSTSQSGGYYYQNLSVPSEISSADKIYGCMLVDNSGVGVVVSVIVDTINDIILVRYTQAPNNGEIILRFLYNAN